MKPKHLLINNIAWYYLYIYYSRNNWHTLLLSIFTFFNQNKESFDLCLIYLGEDRGEHIKVVFSSKSNSSDKLEVIINNHFQQFLNQEPSLNPKEFPYGKGLWCYYPNNTIVWQKFDFNNSYIVYSEKLLYLIYFILEDDMSIDNIFSAALFLSVKQLKIIDYSDNVNLILEALDNGMNDMSLTHSETLKIDFKEVSEIMDSYWDDFTLDGKCESLFYKDWETEIKNILYISPIETNFVEIIMIMCDHLGLGKSYYYMILNFIKKWYALKYKL